MLRARRMPGCARAGSIARSPLTNFVSAAMSFAPTPSSSASSSVLFKGGRVFDGIGRMLDGQGVLVENGRIARVAAAGEFAGFEGQSVDTSGGTLMPGLIDCHVHLLYAGEPDPAAVVDKRPPAEITLRALEHAGETLRGGVVAVRDCGGKDYMEFAVRDACNRGRFLGPEVRAAGRMICMTGGHGNRNGRVADGEAEVVKAVREQIHAGCDLVKIMATGGVMTPGVNPEDAHYSPEEMAAGIAEAQRFHRTTASHAQGAQGILNATRGGITSIEHGIFMTDECIEEMLARGTFVVPTLAALANILENADKGIPDYVLDKARRCADAHRASIGAFYLAGGKIALGTDAGTPFNLHGHNAQELAHMVDVGMAPLDALRAGTSGAAELMRLEGHGRIEAGAAADLLVVDGDPSVDIQAAADRGRHRMVARRGQALPLEATPTGQPLRFTAVAAT